MHLMVPSTIRDDIIDDIVSIVGKLADVPACCDRPRIDITEHVLQISLADAVIDSLLDPTLSVDGDDVLL